MHPQGQRFSLNVAATVAEGVGVVDAEAAVDAEDAVYAEDAVDGEDTKDTVDMDEAVEPEAATKVSAPIAKLTAILQMYAESGNALRRKETPISTFGPSAGSQDPSKSIASHTHV
jgi:hypothetical protein